MRKVAVSFAISVIAGFVASPQGQPIDWPAYNGDAQRTGWEKVDTRITKDNVKDFQLVLKHKLGNGPASPYSLTPPVVIGRLISYRGFKELGFVAGNSGEIWSVDVDMDRIFWQKHIDAQSKGKATGACAGMVTSTPGLIPPLNFAQRPRPRFDGKGAPAKTAAAPAIPPAEAPTPRPTGRGIIAAGGFGAPRPLFGISSDGKLHLMNTSTGDDVTPAMPFLPANTIASGLTVADGIVYTTTTDCSSGESAVWALDLSGPEDKEPAVSHFALKGGSVSQHGGLAIGLDGTVFVQTGSGPQDTQSGQWSNTLLALAPKKLDVAHYFTSAGPTAKSASHLNVVTPVVFTYKGKDVVVTAGSDSRLYLLDGKNAGGDDHKTALSETAPVTAAGGGIWGGISSWQDTSGTRWILMPVWGGVNPELKFSGNDGGAANGSIVAFKVEDHDGKPALTPAWMSRDIKSPEQVVITTGVVFALSAGDYGKDGHGKGSGQAVLYALDGTNGKELYSTGSQVKGPANLTGMTVANGRVFFTTTDGTLYGFGIYMER